MAIAIITAGLLATLGMDIGAFLLVKTRIVKMNGLQVVPSLLGRWAFRSFRGQLFSADIRNEAGSRHESLFGLTLHYSIGLGLALPFFYFHNLLAPNAFQSLILGMSYGLLTNVFPWFVMYPCLGFGICGRKLPHFPSLIGFSLLNHLVYGFLLGLFARLGPYF